MRKYLLLLVLCFVAWAVEAAGQEEATTDLTLFFNGYVRGSLEPCG